MRISDWSSDVCSSDLMQVLSAYFEANSIEGDWEAIEQTSDERLVTSLAMICTLGAPEKQALLESITLTERAEALTAILELATHGTAAGRAGESEDKNPYDRAQEPRPEDKNHQ